MSSVLYPACDVAAARIEVRGLQIAHPRMVLTTTILPSSLAFVDGSVVNVGLPAIGQSLQGDAADLQWGASSAVAVAKLDGADRPISTIACASQQSRPVDLREGATPVPRLCRALIPSPRRS
jgi:hypothetical protein